MAQLFRPSANSLAKLSLVGGGILTVLAFAVGMTLSRGTPNTRVGLALEQPIPFSHQHHATELGIDCRYCHTSVEDSSVAGLPSSETCMSCHSQIWTNSPLLEPVRQSYAQRKPLKWVQINKVPEFVYFNHSIHVQKGVSCNHCHGKIQGMQMAFKSRNLFMGWCLNCHKNPEQYMFEDPKTPNASPRQQVFNMYKLYQKDENMQGHDWAVANVALGKEQRANNPEKGAELVKKRGIQKPQLTDCYTCHR